MFRRFQHNKEKALVGTFSIVVKRCVIFVKVRLQLYSALTGAGPGGPRVHGVARQDPQRAVQHAAAGVQGGPRRQDHHHGPVQAEDLHLHEERRARQEVPQPGLHRDPVDICIILHPLPLISMNCFTAKKCPDPNTHSPSFHQQTI